MFKRNWQWLFLVVLLSVFSFKSLLRPGYFPMHDDMQAMRVLQMDKCFRDGQIPCRWVPDMGYGYGYPQFIYYSPLPYYVMEVFHLGGFSVLDSVKIGFALSFVLSGLAMFLLGKELWGNTGGLVSSIFYIYAPYRASDAFTRGAVGEFWAMVFLPLVFWSILKLVREEKMKQTALLALSLFGLFITHNLTVLMFFPFVILWIFFVLWREKKIKKTDLIIKIILGGIAGVFLAGFFVLPLIFERKFAHIETMIMGYFNYLAHFVSLKQVFVSTRWGFGSSELGPYDDLSFSIGPFHWLMATLGTIILFIKKSKEKWIGIVFLIMGLFSIFLAHQRSVFIWNSLPFMAYLQFPWRFLSIATFCFSAAAGSAFLYDSSDQKNTLGRIITPVILITLVIYLNFSFFTPREWYDIGDSQKFSGESWERQLTISIFDYLPIFASMPPSSRAPDEPLILDGNAQVLSYKKGTDWQKGEIKVLGNGSSLQLPLFYFPGFKVYIDGKPVLIDHDNSLGLITLVVPNGDHQIYAKLKRTPTRALGDALTVLGLIFIIYLIFFIRNERLVKKRS